MTYDELWVQLQKLRRHNPHRMADEIFFLPLGEDIPRPVRLMETNDGSVKGIPTFSLFLSEI